MQKALLSLAILTSPLLQAESAKTVESVMPGVQKNPISLLPKGSVLKGVLLPRYDDQRNLVGDLKAETLTLVDETRIEGKTVRIRFYQPDGSLTGDIRLTKALFNQKSAQLYANEPVKITSDRFFASGTGLSYGFQNGEGFLNGPVTTWIQPEKTTSMNIPRRPAPAMAMALFSSCTTLTSYAAPPAPISEIELTEIKSEAKTLRAKIDTASTSSAESLAENKAKSTKYSKAATAFIQNSELTAIATEKTETAPSTEPLEIAPAPGDTVISCEKGMYFDSDEGVLVYLGNVKVTDPRFTLSGANELKVFFEKNEPAEKTAAENEKPSMNFGEVQQLIATGAVLMQQKSVNGKQPVEASGALLTYNVPKGEIIISGGFPWVKQGSFFARAKEANLTLRLMNSGSFVTRGNWEMGGQLNLKN